MKKLYKKSFHTVLYLDEKDISDVSNKLALVLTRFCGFSDSEPKEIKCIEDFAEGWDEEDSPTTECFKDAKDIEEYCYAISDFTIEEILENNKTQSLEEQIKDLKGENEALKAQLFAIKQYVSI